MAATLSPVMPTTFKFCSGQILELVLVSHLAAKTCKLVKLRTERLQLSLVHIAIHWQEQQQHVVLLEALADEDPLSEAVLHHGEGGEGRAGEGREEEVGGALAPPLSVPLQGLRLGCHRPLPPSWA